MIVHSFVMYFSLVCMCVCVFVFFVMLLWRFVCFFLSVAALGLIGY